MRKAHRFVSVVALSLLAVAVVASCGSDSDDTAGSSSAAGPESFAFGEPADDADADRVIEIDMLDELAFDPDQVEVAAGETVTFRLTNTGKLEHDFTLGDEETQTEHEAEMREGDPGGGMDDDMTHADPNAIAIPPGETADLSWTFAGPGEVLFGCHVQGHYDGGMVGTITVT